MAANAQFIKARAAAAQAFKAMGLPDRHDERWHYTDLSRLCPQLAGLPDAIVDTETALDKKAASGKRVVSGKKVVSGGKSASGKEADSDDALAFDSSTASDKRGAFAKKDIAEQDINVPDAMAALQPHRLVFIDGHFAPAYSTPLTPSKNITSLADAPEAFLPASDYKDGLAAANVAFFTDGLHIHLTGATGAIERPIEIVRLGTKAEGLSCGRLHLTMDAGADITLLETHYGQGTDNLFLHIDIAESAHLHYVKLHYGEAAQASLVQTRLELAAKAQLDAVCLCLQAGFARHDYHIGLRGREAQARLAGLLVASGKQHMDITALLDHQQADTHSDIITRSVLDEQARGVFQGKVVVHRDAQKIDSNQQVKALLLSDRAEMNTKPELEIYADDVACTHGSAIGGIDRDALFFLRSRGLSLAEAQAMLVQGFCMSIADAVSSDDLRAILQNILKTRLHEMSQ